MSINCAESASKGISSGITTTVDVWCSNAPNPFGDSSLPSDKYK